MSKLKFDLVLVDTPDQISKKILKAAAEEFNTRLNKKIARIRERVKNLTINMIKQSDTYESLISGELAAHFGLPSTNRQAMVDAIIEKIGESIKIDVKPVKQFGKGFRGQTTISVMVNDFSDILSMTEAFVSTEKGQILPWLEWLLLKGDAIIISEHDVRLVGGKGRSGGAVMVKNSAAAWRVPPEHSGTIRDNWLTRTLTIYRDKYLKAIGQIIKQELE